MKMFRKMCRNRINMKKILKNEILKNKTHETVGIFYNYFRFISGEQNKILLK